MSRTVADIMMRHLPLDFDCHVEGEVRGDLPLTYESRELLIQQGWLRVATQDEIRPLRRASDAPYSGGMRSLVLRLDGLTRRGRPIVRVVEGDASDLRSCAGFREAKAADYTSIELRMLAHMKGKGEI